MICPMDDGAALLRLLAAEDGELADQVDGDGGRVGRVDGLGELRVRAVHTGVEHGDADATPASPAHGGGRLFGRDPCALPRRRLRV